MVQTSWTDSLSGICFVVILFVFCFSFKTVFLAGYPAIRPTGYPANRISGKRNRISGRIPDIKKGRISGATLFEIKTTVEHSLILKFLQLTMFTCYDGFKENNNNDNNNMNELV